MQNILHIEFNGERRTKEREAIGEMRAAKRRKAVGTSAAIR